MAATQPHDVAPDADRIRVVICDDAALLREGMARLLAEMGFDVIGLAADVPGLMRIVAQDQPDLAVVDVRLPPDQTDEGLRAAVQIRKNHPQTAVLVLSQYVETTPALDLLTQGGGIGYLLKERVADLAEFAAAVRRVVDGERVLDPHVVAALVGRSRRNDPLDRLTAREREVLTLIAEGRSNAAICDRLFVEPKTVETHVTRIFDKLGLRTAPDDNRRVLAVLAYLSQ